MANLGNFLDQDPGLPNIVLLGKVGSDTLFEILGLPDIQ